MGEDATVCGLVASTKYADTSRGRPTFLNLDKPYPTHVFTALIWGSARAQFREPPEVYYKGKHICVSGRIESYRGKPQVQLTNSTQVGVAAEFVQPPAMDSRKGPPLGEVRPSLEARGFRYVPGYRSRSKLEEGDDVEFYDYESGDYKTGTIESIDDDEVELTDEDGEWHSVDRDDLE